MKSFKSNNKILTFAFFILLINNACEKETEYEVLSGQLIGYVYLYDSERHKMSDNSGTEIIVEGSNPQIKTSTDENGQFVIANLKSGIYNIVFKKEGYCQNKIVSYQFVGGNKPASIYQTALYGIPNMQIDALGITDLERQYTVEFRVTAILSNQNENTISYCRYYLNNEPDVSYKNYISSDVAYNYSVNEDISFTLHIDTLKFPTGSELYLIMYPASEPYQGYTDLNSGHKIFTSININKPSEIVNITIPEVEAPWWLK